MSEDNEGGAPATEPVAIITGGARGIGLATARVLLATGWRVVVADRDPLDPDGDDERDAVRAVHAVGVDVTNSASVDAIDRKSVV